MATSEDEKDRDEAEDTGDAAAGEGGDDEGGDEGGEPEAKKATSSVASPFDKPGATAAPAPRVGAPRPPPSAGLGKSITLFVAVVGGLSLAMMLLGTERGGGGPQAPKWSEGQTVDVDITLVSTDKQDLACASGSEVKGLHCGFESQGRRWSKGDANDDKKTLRPYSTTKNVNFFAAGVWSEPALAPDKLPGSRFAVTCKLTIAGKMPRADVRWHEGEGWNNVTDWYAGNVSDCKIGSVQN